MSSISQAEEYLLGQIRLGDNAVWSQLVDRYEGRLLHFAQAKVSQRADCEDIVQETFVAFLKGVNDYRQNCSIETYLFTILRRKIIDMYYRRKRANSIKLIEDLYKTSRYDRPVDALERIPAPDHTGSWYVRRDEHYQLQQDALAAALLELVNGFKKSLNFRDLKIVELIFYCHLSNNYIAKIMNVDQKHVALVKHRCLKKVSKNVATVNLPTESSSDHFENLLKEIWQQQRLSCPKRSTIGAYLLETLDENWSSYVDFHLNQLGCHFCQANLEDLKRQTVENKTSALHARVMESTVGFLRKP